MRNSYKNLNKICILGKSMVDFVQTHINIFSLVIYNAQN